MWGGSVAAGLVAYAVNPVRGDRPHREFLRSWIAGDTDRTTLAPRLAALVNRYAPPAVLVLGFHQALDQGPKTHPWPAPVSGRPHRLSTATRGTQPHGA
jgi:hypothetical protein